MGFFSYRISSRLSSKKKQYRVFSPSICFQIRKPIIKAVIEFFFWIFRIIWTYFKGVARFLIPISIEKHLTCIIYMRLSLYMSLGSKIFNLTTKMRAGVVWANTYNKFDPTSPFGGYKESGFGREGGLHGLMPYLKF